MQTVKQRTERIMSMTHGQLVMHCQDLTAERDKLKSYLLESKNALEDANGLYFSTYTTESQSPYDILINKLGKLL